MSRREKTVVAALRPMSSPAAVSPGMPPEEVAAVCAAVSFMLSDNERVTSVKRASKRASWRGAGDGRSAWSAAGLSELTRPFSAK